MLMRHAMYPYSARSRIGNCIISVTPRIHEKTTPHQSTVYHPSRQKITPFSSRLIVTTRYTHLLPIVLSSGQSIFVHSLLGSIQSTLSLQSISLLRNVFECFSDA